MDKLKKVLSGQDDGNNDGSGILERANQASTLAWGTRMKGFVACFVLGVVCSILGTCLLWIPRVGLAVFAVLYSVGNICALASTMFLIGPCRQLKTMCAKERAFATVIMMVCLALTLCAAFWWKNNGLALIFCVLQFVAFTWYGLSYIPFARDAVIKLCSICV
ncbi:vesicle transport protein SFT2B-like isoform X1 [Sander lucioperca]|uniref:Vesicle transport protein n=1 Tax=Sander lucioperca TaxID=283035 RepID=A0A8C9Z7A6_SANLU|nr:vesicle transport protein SFT2B-like isoform X1 [Sander lucioperca]XP_031172927.1 vesicle transport protein SFT2B-like isoform X2 [Sander lucioperca]XP_035854288.1 vesicle transport protein SFT2B-like isoform X1 [Sander lucioperca]